MEEFKICLIGCGFMTKSGHGPSCAKYKEEHEGVVLAGCCDINLEAAKSVCEQFGFERAYTDYIEMVEKEKPDVVMAITPVQHTCEISCELLKRKIPVILEKPPGMDAEQTRKIHNTAIEYSVPARAAFNRRYTPLVRALKDEIISAKAAITDLDCMFIRVGRTDDDFSTTAIHGIDTVKFIAGSDYKNVSFGYSDIVYNDKKVTNIIMSGMSENGASVNLTFMPCGGCVVERITVNAIGYSFFLYLPVWGGADSPGKLICIKDGQEYKTIDGSELVEHYTLHESNGFYDESRIFFDELRSGKSPESDVISGMQSVEIAQCIRERKDCYIK